MKISTYQYEEVQMLGNRLPRWWLAVFWGSALFAFVYWAYFHIFELGALRANK